MLLEPVQERLLQLIVQCQALLQQAPQLARVVHRVLVTGAAGGDHAARMLQLHHSGVWGTLIQG
jgi:hypothetical protein